MTVELACLETGEGAPLVVLHGLFGSSRNWQGVARKLGDRWKTHALDLRNHGASPWADSMSYPEMAEDVRAFMLARGLEGAAVLGHSMGGKTAMTLALKYPELVGRLIVVDTAPVVYQPVQLPYAQAMLSVNLKVVERRGQVEAMLEPYVPDQHTRLFLLQNLVTGPEGGLVWRVNLRAIIKAMPVIAGFPHLPGRTFDKPSLFIAGGLSDYIQPQFEPAIRAQFPQARIHTIEGTGHWPHADKPDQVAEAVAALLAG